MARFSHAQHVVRVAGLFAVGLLAFLILRWLVVPADFGQYGFYRGGALSEARARPLAYAGAKSCEACHHDTYALPKDWPKIEPGKEPPEDKHAIMRCETCHGPLAAHAADKTIPVAQVGADKLCLTCHREIAGRPRSQPQIVPNEDHGNGEACMSCHAPHFPKPKPDPDDQ